MVRRRWPENPGPLAHAHSTLETVAPADRLSNKDPPEAKSQEHDRRDHQEHRPDDQAIARVERPGRMAVLRDTMAHRPRDLMRCSLQDSGQRLLRGGKGRLDRLHGRRIERFHRFLPSSHDVASPAMAVVRSVGRGATKKPRRSDRSHRGAALAEFKHSPLEQLNDSEDIKSSGGRSIPHSSRSRIEGV
jgi:hypothetical protein